MAAAITSLSLPRISAIRARAFPKAKSKAYFQFSNRLLPPIQSRRSLLCTNAVNDEAALAREAAASSESGAPTIFDKIIAKEIRSSIVYEDDKVLAFRDINPQAPVHVLVIPKFRDGLTELGKAEARHSEVLGQLLYAAKRNSRWLSCCYQQWCWCLSICLSPSLACYGWQTNEVATWLTMGESKK